MLLLSAAGVAVLVYRRRRHGDASELSAAAQAPPSETATAPNVVVDAPYSTDAIQSAQDECYKLAFGVKSFDYEILGEHAAVLDRIAERDRKSVV